MPSSEPLDRFPIIHTTSADAVCDALARIYAEPTLRLDPGVKSLDARLHEFQLRSVQLAFGAYGGSVRLDFPAVDSFVHLLPLRGHGEIVSGKKSAVLAGARTCAIVSPESGYTGHYLHDYEHLVLKIDAGALESKLAVMTGATINAPLRMDLEPDGGQHAMILRHYLPILAGLLNESVAPPPSWWLAQTEQLLMVMFLCGHRHNYSHLLEQEAPDPAPAQVRKAEDFIAENCEKAISLEDLATVSGVSAFSLFRAFRKTRGYSPFEFASRLRSGSARRTR